MKYGSSCQAGWKGLVGLKSEFELGWYEFGTGLMQLARWGWLVGLAGWVG